MNPLLIEQLVNDYLDQELPENQATQVEELLRSDPVAKQIHDELLFLRRAIRSLPQQKLPPEFQDKLFQKIAELPAETKVTTPEKWHSLSFWKKRLTHPRVWTYPLVVLLVASVLLLHDRSQDNDSKGTPQVAVHQPEPGIDDSDPKNYVFHPPLAQETSLPDSLQPVLKSPVIEISCRLTANAQKDSYMLRLFADREIASITRKSGISSNTIYEIEVTQDQLKSLLETMNSDKESVSEILVPYDFASFLTSEQEPDTRHQVRFIVKNRP